MSELLIPQADGSFAPQAPATPPIPPVVVMTPKGAAAARLVFHEIRFRISCDCLCGAGVTLTQDHEQHACRCGAIYRLDGMGQAVVGTLRARRAAGTEGPPKPRKARKGAPARA